MNKSSQHIVISHVYSSDNKGDAALVSVLIDDIRRIFPAAHITILKLEPAKKDDYFEGILQKTGFMGHVVNRYSNVFAKFGYMTYMIIATLVWAVCRRWTGRQLYLPAHLREIVRVYEQAELVVAVGGGYMRSRRGWANRFNIPLLLHPLLFGWLLGKPTVLYSQSMGPFQNRFESWMVAVVLRRMTRVILREDTSLAVLKKMCIINNVVRGIDSGFLLQANEPLDVRQLYHIPERKLLVGVTVRAWLTGAAQARYEQAVAAALDDLVKTQDVHIIFIPQVTAAKGDDDRVVGRRVCGLMRYVAATTLVGDTPDHHRIKAMYDCLDVLLGTRFHSVIFSLTSFVPVLAIEYEHKTSGIMHDLGLDDWVIKIEDVTANRLAVRLRRLVEQRVEYQQQLRQRLPPYVQQASTTANRLAEALPHHLVVEVQQRTAPQSAAR